MEADKISKGLNLLLNTGPYVVLGKILIIIIWFYCLNRFAKNKKIFLLLFGVLAIGALSIIFEILPLKVGYSLPCAGCDRAAYVGLAQTYAAGNPFGEDFAYKGVPGIYSPIYPYLVAATHWITGWDVVRIYDYGATLALVGLGILLFFLGCPRDSTNEPTYEEKMYVGLLMAFSVLYLSTDPVRWQDHYEAFWNTLVLLKPSHLISFFFIPLLYYFISKPLRWKYIIFAGLCLGAMIPTFIVTAVFIICGLVMYMIMTLFFKRNDFKNEFFKICIVCLIGFIFSSWWWWPIFVTHGFLLSSGSELQGGVPGIWWGDAKVVFDPFEATFFMQPLFWFGVVGIVVMLNRRRTGDLLILGLIAAMYLGKFIYPITWVLFKFAPQAWECSMFFLRPAMAMSAAIGLYALSNNIVKNSDRIKEFFSSQPVFCYLNQTWVKRIIPTHFFSWDKKASVIACCLLILTPYATPIWHNPYLNGWWGDRGRPIEEETVDFVDWIKNNTPYNSVFLADGDTAMMISTFTGRKLAIDRDGLNPFINFTQRKHDAGVIYESVNILERVKKLKRYNVSYIVLTDKVIESYPNTKVHIFENQKSTFEKVYESGWAKIFKIK